MPVEMLRETIGDEQMGCRQAYERNVDGAMGH